MLGKKLAQLLSEYIKLFLTNLNGWILIFPNNTDLFIVLAVFTYDFLAIRHVTIIIRLRIRFKIISRNIQRFLGLIYHLLLRLDELLRLLKLRRFNIGPQLFKLG